MEAKQDGDHHHRDAQAGTSPKHGLSTTHLVQEEGGDQRAEHEHHVDAATENLSKFGLHTDVLDEDG